MNWKSINIIGIIAVLLVNLSCGTSEDETPRIAEPYKEQHRPQFHFSPKESQINHLNQMIYYEDEYHLFYQQSSIDDKDEMSWSHAVSSDLVHWEDLPTALKSDSSIISENMIGSTRKRPDLIELKIEGTDETKWVMLLTTGNEGEKSAPNGGSGTQYFVGDFDGKTFTNINSKETTLWLDYGRDNYGGITWSDISAEDGRSLFVGLMNNLDYAEAVPTSVWQSAMTIPRELSLKNTENGLRLSSAPVKELQALRRKKVSVDRANYGFLQNSKLVMNQGTGIVEVLAEFEIPTGSQANFGIELKNANQETYRVGFDAATNHYFSNRTNTGKTGFSEKFAPRIHLAPRQTTGNRIKLHCYFDVSSAEMFTDDGMTVMTDIFFPTEDFIQINVFSDAVGGVELKGFTFYNLESIW